MAAVYAKIDSNKGIDAVRAVAQGPEGAGLAGSERPQVASGVDRSAHMTAYGAKLDTRYKAGAWNEENGTGAP